MAGLHGSLIAQRRERAQLQAQFSGQIGLRHAVHLDDAMGEPSHIAAAVDAWVSLPGGGPDGSALDPMVAAGLFAPLVAQRGSLAEA